jgi:hypothetical protein
VKKVRTLDRLHGRDDLRSGYAKAWETLTLMRLGITGTLAQTLCSTNPCESMIEIVRHTQRSIKGWRDGDMRKRWTAAAMLLAEQQFRRIIGDRDLAKLVIAIERHHTRTTDTLTRSFRPRCPRSPPPPSEIIHSQDRRSKFHDDPDNLPPNPARL